MGSNGGQGGEGVTRGLKIGILSSGRRQNMVSPGGPCWTARDFVLGAPVAAPIIYQPCVGMHNVHRDLERSGRVQGEIYLNHFPRDVKNDLCTRHIRFTSGFNFKISSHFPSNLFSPKTA